MITKQLSIFVENKTGKLAQVTGMIADLGVNIHALSIADTTDFGVLRIIVDNAEVTADELRSNRLTPRSRLPLLLLRSILTPLTPTRLPHRLQPMQTHSL